MATVPPVTLDELKAHLNMVAAPSEDDAELAVTLAAATEACEGEVGPILHRTVRERITVTGCALIVSHPPVVSVEELRDLHGTTYDTSDLDVDRSGLIRGITRDLRPGRYDVTYTAGMAATADDVPAAVKLAVMIVAGHMWETQRGRQARTGFIPGEGITPTDQAALIMSGFSLPRRALELMRPYRLAPAVL